MMLFQRNTEYVRNFSVSTSSGGQNNPIAYGPGSIINGSLMITLDDKPLSAYSIRVIFKCEEQDNARNTTTIFSIQSVIWGNSKDSGLEAQELSSGSHMFLFAIRLPQVNYPPSMHDSPFGHKITYSLQGVFDTVTTTHVTSIIPVIYLPLVTCSPNTLNETSKKTQVFEKEDKKIEVTAELIKPAYCPGDLCTVKMITNNKSDTKISSIQVLLSAIATTVSPTDSVSSYDHKQYTLLTESFYVSIPKQAQNHQDIFRFTIPSTIVPTFTNKIGKYIDIAYEVIIMMGSTSTGWFQGYITNNISLPITITTVPPAYPMQFTVHDNCANELPTFIPNIESPLPSPVNYPSDRAYSVSPSNSFQIKDDLDDDDDFSLNRQDASGHLMVPEQGRRISSSSELSDTTLAGNTISRLETVSH